MIKFAYFRTIIFFLDSRIMSRYCIVLFNFSFCTCYFHIRVGSNVILCTFGIVSGSVFGV